MANQKALTFDRLVEWVEGRLSETETAVITQQLATADPETQATAAWLQKFWHASQTIELPAPPANLRHSLKQRFAARAQANRQPSQWQRFIAQLTFDSWVGASLAGARAIATSQPAPQQLIYSSDLADIALTIVQENERFTLSGQIFSPQAFAADASENAPFVVRLNQSEEVIDFVVADELGNFAFTQLKNGRYSLIVSSDSGELHIAPIQLGQE